MNKLLIFLALVPVLSFAQTREEAEKILEKKTTTYLFLDYSYFTRNSITYREGDQIFGQYEYTDNLKNKPYCSLNNRNGAFQLLNNVPLKDLKVRREGNAILYFTADPNPWFRENPWITCYNVKEKNPYEVLQKFYPLNKRVETLAKGHSGKVQITAINPNDPSECIIQGEEYLKLSKMIDPVTSFGSFELYDKVFLDGRVGSIAAFDSKYAYVSFPTGRVEKVDVYDLQKLNPVKGFDYQEEVTLLKSKPITGWVYGSVIKNGKEMIIVADRDTYKYNRDFYLVPQSVLMKKQK